MFTADKDDDYTAAAHPDERLIARVRAALDRWSTDPSARTPTSSILGTGAIAAVETVMSAHHNDIPAILLPSASYALTVAMSAIGVGPGDDVLLPVLDWPASYAAVLHAGARPVPVAVDAATLTIDPVAAIEAVTPHTIAIVASHLHGVCADIPALRAALPELQVIEDCASALGSSLDGHRAGTMGDVAVFSFGPGKRIDAGEGGVLLACDRRTYRRALAACVHPLRARLSGLEVDPGAMIMRPHPLTAILARDAIAQWDAEADELVHHESAAVLAADPALMVLGYGSRRTNASPTVPVLGAEKELFGAGKTGAVVLPAVRDGHLLRDLAHRIRLVPAASLSNRASDSIGH
ncbi:MAG: DegT/DnrJ/EryC1/StrS aminotransferase [Nocardia sp.]|uniref:DegT/DnrJ/EryC1/StrS family aminotransferase n=1 Tax=Nocardia sp. TaxID=1821 RepID=UPI0026034928|nr:DegT/DnrJ/EryC1/StrS family aminotransferase [Nocardia sp.]MCU1640580.1 DegT/DnrJ/EryC1/StrS aminotransferase [Nocardia sp.]